MNNLKPTVKVSSLTNEQKAKMKQIFSEVKIDSVNTSVGNFEKMCFDAPANKFIFRWSN